ncbi:DUF5320 domain-containing protein [Methanogenium organophilum]|uniref:DUF5320 domain-containing protein n=1 Tax=Methanogenium organophilum TaxID=2199 RepID=A0A9X9S588_METOG|nr:DUF5320 domain-containing protein [Methanogenium organophilum]WAI01693.1 DUF5320 domain-containing protein [Methanogenium organophilum]
MPGFDGTGPTGRGARTGRSLGRCPPAETVAPEEGAAAESQENVFPTPAFPLGRGGGFGMGRGRGARGRGMGRGFWRR